jgi:hypothetical protein
VLGAEAMVFERGVTVGIRTFDEGQLVEDSLRISKDKMDADTIWYSRV